MQRMYRTSLMRCWPDCKVEDLKHKFKESSLIDFIRKYSIADVKTITFTEGTEEDYLSGTVYYYVNIVTSEL